MRSKESTNGIYSEPLEYRLNSCAIYLSDRMLAPYHISTSIDDGGVDNVVVDDDGDNNNNNNNNNNEIQ